MKIIAIRNSYFTKDITLNDEVAIHKGSIYHVTNIHFKPGPQYFLDTGTHYPNGVHFYEVVEQIGFHVVDMFLELPDDLFETETEEQKNKSYEIQN
jgi:hypothetical protein